MTTKRDATDAAMENGREGLLAALPADDALADNPFSIAQEAAQEVRERRPRLLSYDELRLLPAVEFALEGILPKRATTVVYGASGVGKTLLTLSWGLGIATGAGWLGRSAERAHVLYQLGEGSAGLAARVEAWMRANRRTGAGTITFWPENIDLASEVGYQHAREVIGSMARPPDLFVADTVARALPGADENATGVMTQFVAFCDALGDEFGFARLLVHHSGRAGEHMRGSTALEAAADVVWKLSEGGAGLKLECVKARDFAPPDPWNLHLEPSAESVVLVHGHVAGLSAQQRRIVQCVHDASRTGPIAAGKLESAAGLPRSSFYEALRPLQDQGFLAAERQGRSVLYSLTEKGRQEYVRTCPDMSKTPGPNMSKVSPLFRGGDMTGHNDSEANDFSPSAHHEGAQPPTANGRPTGKGWTGTQ